MTRLIAMVAAALIVPGTLFAQETGEASQKMTCPLDGHTFSRPAPQPPGRNTGVDSDLCPHPVGAFALSGVMVTCPRCNYTDLGLGFANATLEEATKTKLFAALATSTYRGLADPLTQIPTWERARLGLTCARARRLKASELVDWHLLGIYSLRIEATRQATRLYGFGDPIRAAARFAAIERRMLDETDAARRARMKLHLAMLSHRMGLPERRKSWLAATLKDDGATAALRLSVERFRKRVRMETSYQRELVAVLGEALAETDLRPGRRTSLVYLKADTLRRLGKLREAAIEFRALRKTMAQTSPRRELCDYFIALLAEHLPAEPDKGT